MNKRMLFIAIWVFVFTSGFILISIAVSASLGTIAYMLGYKDTSELAWFNVCRSAFHYITIGSIFLAAVMGYKGWLPGTGFDKDNPYAIAGESEAGFARKLLKIRCEKITYSLLIKDGMKVYIYTFLQFVLLLLIAFHQKSIGFAVFASGGLVGFLWRDWTELFRTKTLWPFKMKIIDWERVQHLAKKPGI